MFFGRACYLGEHGSFRLFTLRTSSHRRTRWTFRRLKMTSWCRSRTIAFLGLICAAGLLAAWPWSLIGYRGAHLEFQGSDIIYHAVMIHQVGIPDGRNVHTLGEHVNYPIMSHRLAAWALPLFDGNPFLAMRFVAAVTMVVLLAAPFVLLCRVMGPAAAWL